MSNRTYKHIILRKVASLMLAAIFTFNTVVTAQPYDRKTTSDTKTLQVESCFAPMTDVVGKEYDLQLRVETALYLAMAIKPPVPFQDANSVVDIWHADVVDVMNRNLEKGSENDPNINRIFKGGKRLLNLVREPIRGRTPEGEDYVEIELEVFRGENRGHIFTVKITAPDLYGTNISDLFVDEEHIEIDELSLGVFGEHAEEIDRVIGRGNTIREVATANLYGLPAFQNLIPIKNSARIVPYPRSEDVNNILFVSCKFGLGDIVYVETVTDSLMEAYPGARMEEGGSVDIVSVSPEYWERTGKYRNIFPYERTMPRESIERLSTNVRSGEYDLVVFVSDYSGSVSRVNMLLDEIGVDASEIPVIGYTMQNPYLWEMSKWSHELQANTGRDDSGFHNNPVGETSQMINFMRACIDGKTSPLDRPAIEVNDLERSRVKTRLAEMVNDQIPGVMDFNDRTKFMMFNPFTTSEIKEVDWKVFVDGFITIKDELIADNVLIGLNTGHTDKSRRISHSIFMYARSKAVDLPFILLQDDDGEGLGRSDYITFTASADIIVGVDTSSQHIGSAAGVPCLTVFTKTSVLHWPYWQYHAPGGKSFLATKYDKDGNSKDVDPVFIGGSVLAILGIDKDESIFRPEKEFQGRALLEAVMDSSEDLARAIPDLSDDEFTTAFSDMLRMADSLSDLLSHEYRLLAAGCNYHDNIHGTQVGNIMDNADVYRTSNKKRFVQRWLESNLFYLISSYHQRYVPVAAGTLTEKDSEGVSGLVDEVSSMDLTGESVLDLSASYGRVTDIVVARGTSRVLAVNDHQGVSVSGKVHGASEPVVETREGDILDVSGEELFDLIICDMSGDHINLDYTDRFFSGIKEHLRDDGEIIITWPVDYAQLEDDDPLLEGEDLFDILNKHGLKVSAGDKRSDDYQYGVYRIIKAGGKRKIIKKYKVRVGSAIKKMLSGISPEAINARFLRLAFNDDGVRDSLFSNMMGLQRAYWANIKRDGAKHMCGITSRLFCDIYNDVFRGHSRAVPRKGWHVAEDGTAIEHWWVEIDNSIFVDMTHGQFEEMYVSRVIVDDIGEKEKYHLFSPGAHRVRSSGNIGKEAESVPETFRSGTSGDARSEEIDVYTPGTHEKLGTLDLVKHDIDPVQLIKEKVKDMFFPYGGYDDILLSIIALLEHSPPTVYTYGNEPADVIEDLFAFALPDRNCIAIHKSLLDDPVALFHELGELLLGTERSGLTININASLWAEVGIATGGGNTIVLHNVMRFIQEEGWPDSWRKNPHYILRVLQYELFRDTDGALTAKISRGKNAKYVKVTPERTDELIRRALRALVIRGIERYPEAVENIGIHLKWEDLEYIPHDLFKDLAINIFARDDRVTDFSDFTIAGFASRMKETLPGGQERLADVYPMELARDLVRILSLAQETGLGTDNDADGTLLDMFAEAFGAYHASFSDKPILSSQYLYGDIDGSNGNVLDVGSGLPGYFHGMSWDSTSKLILMDTNPFIIKSMKTYFDLSGRVQDTVYPVCMDIRAFETDDRFALVRYQHFLHHLDAGADDGRTLGERKRLERAKVFQKAYELLDADGSLEISDRTDKFHSLLEADITVDPLEYLRSKTEDRLPFLEYSDDELDNYNADQLKVIALLCMEAEQAGFNTVLEDVAKANGFLKFSVRARKKNVFGEAPDFMREEGPLPDISKPGEPEAERVYEKAHEGADVLSIEEEQAILRQMIYEYRIGQMYPISDVSGEFPESLYDNPITQLSSSGMNAQCIPACDELILRLASMNIPGLSIYRFNARESVFFAGNVGHDFIIVRFGAHGRHYLIDATVRQFTRGSYSRVGEYLLANDEDAFGRLLRQGYMELTDDLLNWFGGAFRQGLAPVRFSLSLLKDHPRCGLPEDIMYVEHDRRYRGLGAVLGEDAAIERNARLVEIDDDPDKFYGDEDDEELLETMEDEGPFPLLVKPDAVSAAEAYYRIKEEDDDVTDEDVQVMLDTIVYEYRKQTMNFWTGPFGFSGDPSSLEPVLALSGESLQGACEKASDDIIARIYSLGLPGVRVFRHNASDEDMFDREDSHYFAVVHFEATGKSYIIDPTVRQFYSANSNTSGTALAADDPGLSSDLLRKGYIELTDENADWYGNGLRQELMSKKDHKDIKADDFLRRTGRDHIPYHIDRVRAEYPYYGLGLVFGDGIARERNDAIIALAQDPSTIFDEYVDHQPEDTVLKTMLAEGPLPSVVQPDKEKMTGIYQKIRHGTALTAEEEQGLIDLIIYEYRVEKMGLSSEERHTDQGRPVFDKSKYLALRGTALSGKWNNACDDMTARLLSLNIPGLMIYRYNSQDAELFDSERGHEFLIVRFAGTGKYYLLDPTIRQFFRTRERRIKKYLLEKSREDSEILLRQGYLELNDKVLTWYGNGLRRNITGDAVIKPFGLDMIEECQFHYDLQHLKTNVREDRIYGGFDAVFPEEIARERNGRLLDVVEDPDILYRDDIEGVTRDRIDVVMDEFRYIKKNVAKYISGEGTGEAIDIEVDISLFPYVSEPNFEAVIDEWAYLILYCLDMENVNFVFKTPDPMGNMEMPPGYPNKRSGPKLRAKVIGSIKERIFDKDIDSRWSKEQIDQRVRDNRDNAITISVWSQDWFIWMKEKGVPLGERQYAVALKGQLSDRYLNTALWDARASLTVGLCEAALAIAKKDGGEEEMDEIISDMRMLERMQAVYDVLRKGPDRVTFTLDTLRNMVHEDSEERLNLSIALALPPAVRLAAKYLIRVQNNILDCMLTL